MAFSYWIFCSTELYGVSSFVNVALYRWENIAVGPLYTRPDLVSLIFCVFFLRGVLGDFMFISLPFWVSGVRWIGSIGVVSRRRLSADSSQVKWC